MCTMHYDVKTKKLLKKGLTFGGTSRIITLVGRARQCSDDDAELCNGSTYDSDSYCLGSNPSPAAILYASMV